VRIMGPRGSPFSFSFPPHVTNIHNSLDIVFVVVVIRLISFGAGKGLLLTIVQKKCTASSCTVSL
jgi:hypothetical protein